MLVTSLLLQDGNTWQSLWYPNITSLFIIAPKSYHDAMQRLNLWVEGPDYERRAWGAFYEPPLDEINEIETNYYDQGLSSEEFSKRVEPILRNFKY